MTKPGDRFCLKDIGKSGIVLHCADQGIVVWYDEATYIPDEVFLEAGVAPVEVPPHVSLIPSSAVERLLELTGENIGEGQLTALLSLAIDEAPIITELQTKNDLAE